MLRAAIESAGGLAAMEADPDRLHTVMRHAGVETQFTVLAVRRC